MEYRLYEDLRRGWGVVQPHLEQCGLLRVDYEGLEELAAQEGRWRGLPFMAVLPVPERARVLRALLDELRRRLANALAPNGQTVVEFVYAPAATLWHINHRWKHSGEMGFRLEIMRGFWQERDASCPAPQGQAGPAAPGTSGHRAQGMEGEVRSNVRPFVRITANALLLHPSTEQTADEPFLSSLQYALKRGLQAVFQVEDNELASEWIGQGDRRGLLLWEAAEGGAGGAAAVGGRAGYPDAGHPHGPRHPPFRPGYGHRPPPVRRSPPLS